MFAHLTMGGKRCVWIAFIMISFFTATASAQQVGSIRGIVMDNDFDVPLAAARISIPETGEKVTATDEGNFVFSQIPPGNYTVVFSKEGYTRKVQADVVVLAGQMTEADAALSGEFTEMEEFIVQDLQIGGGSEAGLLKLRIESPALMDSISADLMSQAGAGDAASALQLVSGATVQDGKFAVIRGLPDRYVSSQMNGVRLPSADPDKRAVQLDQFPSAVIESIQVSKTFMPDQQGDASGGAVNVVLKGIPKENMFKVKVESSYNTQVLDNKNEFLTYTGGGVNFSAKDNKSRHLDNKFFGAVGVFRGDAPINSDISVSSGGKKELPYDIKVGGFANMYYKRYSSYYNDGVDESYWVKNPGDAMTPRKEQQTSLDDFKTSIFDVTQGMEGAQWGGLGTVGVETKNHSLNFLYMYTRVAEDKAMLFEDTRGKKYFFPGYDVNNPQDPGNQAQQDAAPYLRNQTLEYTERTTRTQQLNGKHTLPIPDFGIKNFFKILSPKIDWTFAKSSSSLYQPDKRQFGSFWWAEKYYNQQYTGPEQYRPFKPSANYTLGNFQRIWKRISEKSEQSFVNGKIPFTQWSGDKGYVKLGAFYDRVLRTYNQDSFSNFNDNAGSPGSWENFWSDVFLGEGHPMTASDIDVNYKGKQVVSAWYYMVDLPVSSFMKLIGGVRYEITKIDIVNKAEKDVHWVSPNDPTLTEVPLLPGAADVAFKQIDELPAYGIEFTPFKQITLRGSYSQTVARQTFKELTPIQQMEFLGSDVFIGNPFLKMSALKNYDVRFDYRPYESGLISLSGFYKGIKNPIEYVQKRTTSFGFTTPVNYPKGRIRGYEIEVRQKMGFFFDKLEGLTLGGNATFIDSQVTVPNEHPNDDGAILAEKKFPMGVRNMLNAPKRLYNAFLTYELERFGTKFGVFYMVKGDTLVVGAGIGNGKFIPNVYAKEYKTLNLNVSQKIGKSFKLTFQVKNLLNPKIQTVYRSDFLPFGDKVKTSYRKGVDYSLSLTGEW